MDPVVGFRDRPPHGKWIKLGIGGHRGTHGCRQTTGIRLDPSGCRRELLVYIVTNGHAMPHRKPVDILECGDKTSQIILCKASSQTNEARDRSSGSKVILGCLFGPLTLTERMVRRHLEGEAACQLGLDNERKHHEAVSWMKKMRRQHGRTPSRYRSQLNGHILTSQWTPFFNLMSSFMSLAVFLRDMRDSLKTCSPFSPRKLSRNHPRYFQGWQPIHLPWPAGSSWPPAKQCHRSSLAST